MKIFSAAQIRACDAYTIHASGISSIELMERAAAKCADWLDNNFTKDTLFIVLCGPGNNGGDGLALTRMLHHVGYRVKAFLVKFSEKLSPDCQANLDRLRRMDSGLVQILNPESFITDIPANIVIIDAILGTGLSRPTEGWVAAFINNINLLPNKKIAIDIPSGLPSDGIPDVAAAIIYADHTLSFQFYKRSFLHPETGPYAGQISILDIGLHNTFIDSTHTQYNIIDAVEIRKIYRPRKPFSHKGTYGHALLVGGSHGKMGAITLASKAALRAGSGLVTALIPHCGNDIIQTAIPEVMSRTSGDTEIATITDWENYKAIGIGPGMDTKTTTAKAFATFLDACKQPLVIDADALNIMAAQHDILANIPPGSILTPHPKEFARLFGESINSMLQLEQARAQAMRYNIFIVLKDHHTVVVTPDGECWYNNNGNAGMATGGSGDVLTGIITGLFAQGYDSRDAAVLGVYLHGLAGDIAAANNSQEAMTASDIIGNLGKAYKGL